MHEHALQAALSEIIKSDYFLETKSSYCLRETDTSGESELLITVTGEDSLCIENFDKKPHCCFLKSEKAPDHLLFQQNDDGEWIVYIIEMKTSVGSKTFNSARNQVQSGYLHALAIAAVLGILISQFHVVLTYGNDKFSTNPATIKAPLGEDFRSDSERTGQEWWKEEMSILGKSNRKNLPFKKIQMRRNEDTKVLHGELSI